MLERIDFIFTSRPYVSNDSHMQLNTSVYNTNMSWESYYWVVTAVSLPPLGHMGVVERWKRKETRFVKFLNTQETSLKSQFVIWSNDSWHSNTSKTRRLDFMRWGWRVNWLHTKSWVESRRWRRSSVEGIQSLFSIQLILFGFAAAVCSISPVHLAKLLSALSITDIINTLNKLAQQFLLFTSIKIADNRTEFVVRHPE